MHNRWNWSWAACRDGDQLSATDFSSLWPKISRTLAGMYNCTLSSWCRYRYLRTFHISARKIHICAISYYNLLQAAADRHLLEKGQIRDTLGLLRLVLFSIFNEADVTLDWLSNISVTLDFLFFFRIYQKSAPRPGGGGDEHEEKRKRARKGNK